MKLKIVNKTGRGSDTEIRVIDGNREIGNLTCVRRIVFDDIDPEGLILANLYCYIRDLDMILTPKKETLPLLQHIHNQREMSRMGLGRIN